MAAVLAGVLALGACGEEDVPTGVLPQGDQGRFRVVHAIADPTRADRVNITVANVPVAVNVAFGVAAPNTVAQPNPAPYYPIEVGSWPVALRRTADTTVKLVDATIAVTANTDYTIYAVGSATAGITTFITTDVNTVPTANTFRVVHASPSSPAAVDVYLTSATADIASLSPSFSNLAFKAATANTSLAPQATRVRITAAGSKTPLLDATVPALAAGAIRTLVFLDKAAGGTPATSSLLVDR